MAKEKKSKPNIFEMFFDEAKKVNWNEVNKMTNRPISVGLVGSKENIGTITDWLYSMKYNLSFGAMPTVISSMKKSKKCLCFFDIDKEIDEKLLKSMSFCIVDEQSQDKVRRLQIPNYLFNSDSEDFCQEILGDNEELLYPLAYNFPVFRPVVARGEIQKASIQNGAWAVGTTAPNIIPGPQQVVTVPIEAISDFAVLTANEIKLLFSLQGISGYKANPLKAAAEYVIVASLAKLAQTAATNTVGKIPAGAGLALKGAIAYAFTMAIGEALFFYMITGTKVGKDFFSKAMPEFIAQGKQLFGKKNRKAK